MPKAATVVENEEIPRVEMVESKDIIGTDDAEVAPNPEDPRAAIYAKRDEQLRQQAGEEEKLETEEKPETKEKPVDEEITVVVNGREKLVAKSRIDAAGGVAAYQQRAAASEMLNQASADTRRLREHELHIQEREKQVSLRENAIIQTRNAEELSTPDALKEMVSEYHNAILNGEVEQAGSMLIKIQTTQSAMVVNKDEIASNAVRQARAEMDRDRDKSVQRRFEAERQEANLDFEERFPDVADDAKLRSMANHETIVIQAAHPDWSPKAIITEAAQSVRKWITERTAISSSEAKLNLKRATSNIRGGSAVAATRSIPPPQTKSNYVEQLRKQRGLE